MAAVNRPIVVGPRAEKDDRTAGDRREGKGHPSGVDPRTARGLLTAPAGPSRQIDGSRPTTNSP
jgi:hypothetical protein